MYPISDYHTNISLPAPPPDVVYRVLSYTRIEEFIVKEMPNFPLNWKEDKNKLVALFSMDISTKFHRAQIKAVTLTKA